MTVQYPAQARENRPPSIGWQIGELLDRQHGLINLRFDRLDRDIAELKSGLTGTNERLDRMELANERRSNRMDANFERLVGLIQRDEGRS